MASHVDQENQIPPAPSGVARLGVRKDNAQKPGLSVLNPNVANVKKFFPPAQLKKTSTFTIFDENAIDHTDRVGKASSAWPQPPVTLKQVVDAKPKFSIFQDDEATKAQQQIAAKASQFQSSVNTLKPREEAAKASFKIEDASPMVIDDQTEEADSITSLSELNRHLESILPEVYLDDIYKYLRDCEERHRPKPHYMRKQSDITAGMRAILIDWLVEVAEEYKLHNETLFLAVSYIDRFLSHMSVLRGKLQLVGTAAMFIASKYEEIYPPEVGEFVYITDDTYTKKQVLRMEHLILKVLAFELAVPTTHYFLQRFAQLSRSSEATLHLATYLCELTLMETEPYLHYLPSLVAASCVALARLSSGNEIWPSHMCASTGYTLEQLMPCIKDLHTSWSQVPNSPQQAIREKYKADKWHSVSLMTPPPLSTLDLAQF